MQSFENLELEKRGKIAVLRVNRPKVLNALNRAVLAELEQAFDTLGEDQGIASVILTGSGEKAFVAGADIRELDRLDPLSAREYALRGQRIFSKIERFPKPVIAAVNGFCLGGGCELAMACHIRVASRNAKLGQPEVKLGLIPGFGGTQRLTRLVGRNLALEFLLSGEMISAERAAGIGLVNRVVEPEELLSVCIELAGQILANGPVAVQYCLEAVQTATEVPLEEGLAYESALFGLCFATEDQREGTSAFLEKRKATFSGK